MTSRMIAALGLFFGLAAAVDAQVFTGALDGTQESPVVATAGIGTGTATFDPLTNMLAVDVSFSGLTSNTTNSHIHCCFSDPPSRSAGVAVGFVPTGFPLGVTSGSYSNTFDLLDSSIYTAAFLNGFGGGTAAGARDALLAGMTNGTAYFNVHTSSFGGGEIRGDITAVPEPSTIALAGLGALVLSFAVARRRNRRCN
ncbi:MAG: CHRD domain-containing protein [Pirellulales bacterium]